MDPFMSILAPFATKNELCREHTIKYVQNIFNGSAWALKMLDSSTKIPSGILTGTTRHFGVFDECVSVNVYENWGSFRGQYCLLSILVSASEFSVKTTKDDPGNVYASISVCVPSSCTSEDVEGFYKFLMPSRNITVNPHGCQIGLPPPFTPLDYITIGVLVFFAVLCILSTCYDLIFKDTANCSKLLTTFSWYTNGRALLTTKASKESLTVLQGIRFFSMAWVVYGHMYMVVAFLPFVNGTELLEKWRDWPYMAVYGALFAVDTFFLLSGTLVSYLTLAELKKGVKFNIPAFYVYRYLRMTPLVVIVILVNVSIYRHFSSGPLWDMYVSETEERCRANWWAALLYIQNFYEPMESCQGVLWYLSADFQLYLLSPPLLILLHRRPRFGLVMLQVLTVVMVAVSYVINWMREVPTTIIMSRPKYFPAEYQHTHLRCAPWLIGMSLGTILLHTKEWRSNIEQTPSTPRWRSTVLISAAWMLTAVMLLAPVLCLYPFQQEDYEFSAMDSALFLSLSRPLWGMGVALLIFLCVSHYGGVVNQILSCRVLRPLARLTFAMYLLHLSVIGVATFSIRTGVYVNHFDQIMKIISVLVVTAVLSVVASLMFESPVIALVKILLARSQGGRAEERISNRKSEETSEHQAAPPSYELCTVNTK